MYRFNQHRPLPHLNVHSQNLVFLTNVPTSTSGKDLKNRLAYQFGPIKFVETFEAWNHCLTGNIVIDFYKYDNSKAFMTAVFKRRINFLDGVGIQHIGVVDSRRHFFELIHRNTNVDLLNCDGKPPSADWICNRRPNRPSRGKPYDRPPPRNENSPSATRGRGRCGHKRDRNSLSEKRNEMVGPFPTSSSLSASLRRLIKYSVWESQSTGKSHILQFSNKQIGNRHSISGKCRRSRTLLPLSPRSTDDNDNNSTSRRHSASAHRHRSRHSISSSTWPQLIHHRPRISSFVHQPKPQQISNKNGHHKDYNNIRCDNHVINKSRIEPIPMVIGLDLTKERMRQARRQHHRYLRTPSPQFCPHYHHRKPIPLNQLNPQQQLSMALSSGTSSSSSSTPTVRLFSPIRGAADGGLFMFRALPSNNAKRGAEGSKKRQMARNGLEPDIIFSDASSSSNGINSFFSTPSLAVKSNKNAKTTKNLAIAKKVRRSSYELEEGELTDDETNGEGIEGGGEREEPMEIDADGQGGKIEEKKAGNNEEEEEKFDPDAYEAPFELVEDEEVHKHKENNSNQQGKGAREEGNSATDNEQIDAPKTNNNNVDVDNIDDILDGDSEADLSEIDGSALLDETDDEQKQHGEEYQKKSAKSFLVKKSPQNSQIDNEEILLLQVRRISIGKDENETAGSEGGPIGIGRKGQRIQIVKSEIMEEAEMGAEGNGGSNAQLLLL